jgi:hypothetical protein
MIIILLPNGLTHLSPVLARQLTHYGPNSRKLPLYTHAEGGQVQLVLGSPTYD